MIGSSRGAGLPAGSPSESSLERRGERLVELARTRTRALILTHDNPDPDGLSSALALAQIFEEKAGIRSTLAFGGLVGRAENRALLRVLKLPFVRIHRVALDEHDLVCLVDTQPEARNHSLPPSRFPDVIVDHHPELPASRDAAIAEVGGGFGATASILTHHLRALRMIPTREVATALFYGIKADTRDLGRETMPADVEAYVWLFPFTDKEALAQIEHPRLPAEYFRLFHTALERGVVHGNAVLTDLGTIYSPDMVAEVAERHLFLEGIKWSLALALFDGNLFLSLRTNDRRMNVGRQIREIVEELGGSAGGHGQMAGGRIPVGDLDEAALASLKSRLLRRFLEEWGLGSATGVPLLAYRLEGGQRG